MFEAARRRSKRAKLVINDEYLHAVTLKSLLQSGEYETETREWSKLPEDEQTWEDRKNTFRAAYVAKWRLEAAREGEQKTFGGSALFGVAPVGKDQEQKETPTMSHKYWTLWRSTQTTSRRRRRRRRRLVHLSRNWRRALLFRWTRLQGNR